IRRAKAAGCALVAPVAAAQTGRAARCALVAAVAAAETGRAAGGTLIVAATTAEARRTAGSAFIAAAAAAKTRWIAGHAAGRALVVTAESGRLPAESARQPGRAIIALVAAVAPAEARRIARYALVVPLVRAVAAELLSEAAQRPVDG